MSCRICDCDPCACAPRAPTMMPIGRSTYVPQPLGITKEEFGREVYDTIKTIGGICGLHDQIAGAIHRGEGWKGSGLKDQLDALRKDLATQMPLLTPEQTVRILAAYPMVKTL